MSGSTKELPRGVAVANRLAAWALVALMAVGSIALWTVVPLMWIWFAAEVGGSYFISYLVALAGAPLTMIALGIALYRVQNRYASLSGATDPVPQRQAWLRSINAERTRRPTTLLDLFLIVSAVVALVALIAWYFGFADAINPTGPLAPGNEHGS